MISPDQQNIHFEVRISRYCHKTSLHIEFRNTCMCCNRVHSNCFMAFKRRGPDDAYMRVVIGSNIGSSLAFWQIFTCHKVDTWLIESPGKKSVKVDAICHDIPFQETNFHMHFEKWQKFRSSLIQKHILNNCNCCIFVSSWKLGWGNLWVNQLLNALNVLYLKVKFNVFVSFVYDVTVIFQGLGRIDINDVGITNGSIIKSL